MSNERMLAFNMATRLDENEIKDISARGVSSGNVTGQITLGVNAETDHIIDGGGDF